MDDRSLETPAEVVLALRALARTPAIDLPLPGRGSTIARYRALAEIAARDLSLARLFEGHTDAIAILAESGRAPRSKDHLYGVWCAEPPDAKVTAERTPAGWILRGRKRYASGAEGLDRALVSATASDGGRLFDVDLSMANVKAIPDTWRAVGMSATESLEVVFDEVAISESDAVGAPGFYLARPGFWHGAVGVAACWYGGALGAFRMLRSQLARAGAKPSEHALAHLGAISASCAMMDGTLESAARAIDDDPENAGENAETRALVARHLVEQGCQEVLTRVGRAGGTGPLVFDRAHARRAADLVVYLRQHHAERDLASLGAHVLASEIAS